MATAATWHDTIPTNQIKPETSDFGTIKNILLHKAASLFFPFNGHKFFFLNKL